MGIRPKFITSLRLMCPPKAAKILIKSYDSKRFGLKQSIEQGTPFSPLLAVFSLDSDVRTLLQQCYISGKEARLPSVLTAHHVLPAITVFLPTALHHYCTFLRMEFSLWILPESTQKLLKVVSLSPGYHLSKG